MITYRALRVCFSAPGAKDDICDFNYSFLRLSSFEFSARS